MNTQSIDEALEATENALRDFIQEVLEKQYGNKWLEKCGIPEKRRKQWEEYRDKEKEKDISGKAEDRILYYSDLGDLRRIINYNWKLFEPCFADQNKIVFYLKELEGLRNTKAHRRKLLPHQSHLVSGYCGEIGTAIDSYRTEQVPETEIPAYAQATQDEISLRLEESDSLVLKLACEKLVKIGYRVELLSPSDVVAKAKSFGMSENDILESLEVLDRLGYIKIGGVGGTYFEVTEWGFDVYCNTYVDDYVSIQREVGLEIENKGADYNKSIAESLNQPQILIDHILRVFELNGFLRLYSTIGGDVEIYEVSSLLKRWLRSR